jgi:hypothetical protein
MQRIILLTLIGTLIAGAWAWAKEQQMLNHPADLQMQQMQDASCPPSSNPSGGG